MINGENVLVTGGGGYVGAVLVPELMNRGYRVTVLDNFMFDENVFKPLTDNDRLTIVKGDIRDSVLLDRVLDGIGTIIHLAAISNDPCSDLDAELTQAVNHDAIVDLVQRAKDKGVKRFISASSSSVYGIKEDPDVTEDLPLAPITLYARLKAESEELMRKAASPDFTAVSIRCATVCGFSPRMRLDLTVNILTSLAVNNGLITVFGGTQKRPNVFIADAVNMYAEMIEAPAEKINGDVFNFGAENFTVMRIAEMVKEAVGYQVKITVSETDDNRSYYISSAKIKERLGLVPLKTIPEAIEDVRRAFAEGRIPDFQNSRYYNIKKMQEIKFT